MPAVSPICRSHTLQTSQAPAMCAPVCLSDVAASHLWPVSHCHRQSRHDNSCVVLIRSKRRQLMTHSQTPGVMLIIITHLTPPQALYKQTWNSKTKQPSCSAKKKSSFQPHHHHHICCTSCLLQSDPPQKKPKKPSYAANRYSFQPHHHHHCCCTSCLLQGDVHAAVHPHETLGCKQGAGRGHVGIVWHRGLAQVCVESQSQSIRGMTPGFKINTLRDTGI